MAEQATAPPLDPEEQAWLAFAEADTPTAMQQAVTDFPLLAQAAFVATIEQTFAQRLTWLRQIANLQTQEGSMKPNPPSPRER